MNRGEMIAAADRLSERLREIAANIRDASAGDEYLAGEIAALEGIADALNAFDET